MKKNILTIIVIVLSITNLLILWKSFEWKNESGLMKDAIGALENRISLLGGNYVSSSSAPKFELSQILRGKIEFGNKYKIVFRFKQTHCNYCIEQELENLRTIYSLIDPDNILLLVSFNNQNSLNAFIKTNDLESFEIVNTREYIKEISIDDIGVPLIFVLNENFEASNLFIPAKEFPYLSIDYYHYIIEQHFK